MSRLSLTKLTCCVIAVFSTVAINTVFASNPVSQASIYATSIKWDDVDNRLKLLASAPKWNDEVVTSLFQAYLTPNRFELPAPAAIQQYNVQFINAFWGPLNNPFSKYSRPAKAFIFFNKSSSAAAPQKFYMAPLVKNLADGNYYIFDNKHTQPLLLNEWVADLRNIHGFQTPVSFNICNGYGNLPADSCMGKSYTEEAGDLEFNAAARKHSALEKQVFSAHRDINEDWKSKISTLKKLSLTSSDTIYGSSISWKEEKARNKLLNTVTAWPNYKTIKDNFEKIRDIRYFTDPEYPNFQRRISWLYPDDGCWTRATAVIRDLFGPFNNLNNDAPRPSKVFAFGNLCAITSNSPDGMVQWWYHTAPIVRDAETNITYVLDPSINPYMPISMEKWAEAIASNTGACGNSSNNVDQFNICNGYGTGPMNRCKSPYDEETANMRMQSSYQSYERERQEELGRDADAVLGDLPPWLN